MVIDFIGKRKISIIISMIIIIAGLFSLMFQGLNMGIDFVGGTKYMLQFSEPVSSESIRQVLAEHQLEGSYIQATENNQFIIRTLTLSEGDSEQLIRDFNTRFGSIEVLSNEVVSSVISSELKEKAFIAVIVASILMLIYIAFRFELSFAVAAIIALLYDMLITLSFFSLLQIEINSSFIAALLTIIGYSINDTIVIFDRIRENLLFKQKETLNNLVNRSINQSIIRSINTSITSIVVLLALLLLGGETTKVFALAMIIGFSSGTYSSIFIASPAWLEIKKRGFGKDYSKKSKKAVPVTDK